LNKFAFDTMAKNL